SKYHSRIVLKDGKFIIVDMKSTNGTYVNGKKIAAPQVVRPSDKIYIGDYIINVEAPSDGEAADEHDEASDASAVEDGGDGGDGGVMDEEEGEGGDEEAEAANGEEEPLDEEEEVDPAPKAKDKGRMPASMAAALARRKHKIDPRLEAYSRLQKDIHDRLIEYL